MTDSMWLDRFAQLNPEANEQIRVDATDKVIKKIIDECIPLGTEDTTRCWITKQKLYKIADELKEEADASRKLI